MSKHGKKFNAHEKHFEQKEIRMRQQNRQLMANLNLAQHDVNTLMQENTKLRHQNEKLKTENKRLTDLIDYLKSADELPEGSVKSLIYKYNLLLEREDDLDSLFNKVLKSIYL